MPLLDSIAPSNLMRALQDSIDRRKRQNELHRATPVPPRTSARAEWLGVGRSTAIAGFATGDLVYAGSRLAGLDGSRIEPSLLDPSLPVDPLHANTHGEQMTYWPSYDSITASSRRAHLQWLAGGRQDPNAYIGYVFLFFYGLERRVYECLQNHASSEDELLAIAREVARLIDLYARSSGSFASYAGSFLDLLACIVPRARTLVEGRVCSDGPPASLRLTLGELALTGKPIPAQHALAWVRSARYLNTPAQRCADEFELLFHIHYAQKFGDGLSLKPGRPMVEISYRPASATLDLITLKRNVPDVTLLSRPLAQLIALTDDCCAALDAYSRFLGKNENGRESLAAFALLPDELVEATPSADATAIAELVRSRLDDAGRAHLAAAELLQHVRMAKPGKVSKSESMLLAQALEKLGYGIEPDVRLGGPSYEVEGRVVVFRRLPDCPSIATDEYATATLLMRLAAMVTTADDAVSQAEREHLEQHIEARLQLTAGERQRLGAHLAWLLESELTLTGLRKKLAMIAIASRKAIARVLVEVAATDGHVDPRELKILEKLYAALALDTADLYRDVHAVQSNDDEPVAVAPPAPAKGFAIPPEKPKSAIDMDRVRLKIDETRQVSSLLSSIFVEEDAPPAAAPAIQQANTIGTLDAAHSELLRRLAQRESWPRDEVERLANELALLTDGALEALNDYAYTKVAEPLWEDDDPILIHSNVIRELIA
ncbi:MAG: TerB N-terminal domain-containing protein [Thermoanaerobaculia bacterium]